MSRAWGRRGTRGTRCIKDWAATTLHLPAGWTLPPRRAESDLQTPRVPEQPAKTCCQEPQCSCGLAGNRKRTVTAGCDLHSLSSGPVDLSRTSPADSLPVLTHPAAGTGGCWAGCCYHSSAPLDQKESKGHSICRICELFKHSFCSWEFEVKARRGQRKSFNESF